MIAVLIVVLSLLVVLALFFMVAIYKKPLKKRPVLDLVSNLQQANISLKSELHKVTGVALVSYGSSNIQNFDKYINHLGSIVNQHKATLNHFHIALEPFQKRREYQYFYEVCESYYNSQLQLIKYADVAIHDLPLASRWLETYRQICTEIDSYIYFSANSEEQKSQQQIPAQQTSQKIQQLLDQIDIKEVQSSTLQDLAKGLVHTIQAILMDLQKYQQVITDAGQVTAVANQYNQTKQGLDIASYENLFTKDFSYHNLDIAETAINQLVTETPHDS